MTINKDPIYVRIQDFQSIEDVELEISGLTVITGKTNIGKSSILRAISGAFKNIPVVGLIRKGKKFCSVKIRSKELNFLWEKGAKGVNRYSFLNQEGNIISDADGKPKVLDKIGQGPIDEVIQSGFSSIEIGDAVCFPWYADQFNPIFLLDKSGTAITDFFSEVANLKVLQDAVVLCARKRKRALEEAKIRGEEIIKFREKEKKIENLDNVVQLMQELSEQSESIKKYDIKIKKGIEFHDTFLKIQEKLLILSQSIKIPSELISEKIANYKKMSFHWQGLEKDARRIKKIRDISLVDVPIPPKEEIANYKKIVKYEGLDKIKNSIQIFENIKECKFKKIEIDFQKLKRIEFLKRDLKSVREKLLKISTDTTVPNLSLNIEKFVSIQRLNLEISKIKIDLISYNNRQQSLSEEIKSINIEISKIPSCSACNRPILSEHSHVTKVSA